MEEYCSLTALMFFGIYGDFLKNNSKQQQDAHN
jgi:hypothetical protein